MINRDRPYLSSCIVITLITHGSNGKAYATAESAACWGPDGWSRRLVDAFQKCRRVADSPQFLYHPRSGCRLTVYSVSENLALAREHGVRVVPTGLMDGGVKIEGHPDIPFVCDDDTYAHFKEKYPLLHELGSSER